MRWWCASLVISTSFGVWAESETVTIRSARARIFFFGLAGVHAEIAVGGFQQSTQVVEAERVVDGEGADDAEAQALVDDAIEVGEIVEGPLAGGLAGLGRVRGALGFSRHVSSRSGS